MAIIASESNCFANFSTVDPFSKETEVNCFDYFVL